MHEPPGEADDSSCSLNGWSCTAIRNFMYAKDRNQDTDSHKRGSYNIIDARIIAHHIRVKGMLVDPTKQIGGQTQARYAAQNSQSPYVARGHSSLPLRHTVRHKALIGRVDDIYTYLQECQPGEKVNDGASVHQQRRAGDQQQTADKKIRAAAAQLTACTIGERSYEGRHEQRYDRARHDQPAQYCCLLSASYLAGRHKEQNLCRND